MYHVLFVASTGGHLAQFMELRPWWSQVSRAWVTFDKADARSSLADERFHCAYHPTTRNLANALRNLRLARKVIAQESPDVVVSDGAGVSVPFFIEARRRRIPTVYLEVFDRVDTPTLSGRICRPLASAFCTQWPEQLRLYPGAENVGLVVWL